MRLVLQWMWLCVVHLTCHCYEQQAVLFQSLDHLVDPASSHMLVSKTKPCMFQTQLFIAYLRMAH